MSEMGWEYKPVCMCFDCNHHKEGWFYIDSYEPERFHPLCEQCARARGIEPPPRSPATKVSPLKLEDIVTAMFPERYWTIDEIQDVCEARVCHICKRLQVCVARIRRYHDDDEHVIYVCKKCIDAYRREHELQKLG